jgi:hypothetical protein
MSEARNNILFVVGIDRYGSPAWPDLNNATLDSREIISVLTERYGFETYPQPLYNDAATKKNIIDGLTELRQYVAKGDNVVVYFAGHGQMNPVSGRGYWVPYGASLDIDTLLENSILKDFMEDIDVQHALLISDSCFSGTFLSRTRGPGGAVTYADLDRKKSRWMFASGREERVSDGNPGEHSPFSRYMLQYLNENDNRYTSVKEIVRYVSALTMKASHQSPFGSPFSNIGDEGGEMVFTLKENFYTQEKQETRGTTHTVKLRNEQLLNSKRDESFAAGKEILFGFSLVDSEDYMIFENFRFDDAGNKKLSFENDAVVFKDGTKMRLVQRFATNTGLMRYLDYHENNFKGSKVVFLRASEEIDQVESTAYAIAHSEYLEELLSFNKDQMTCLHCGEKITDDRCYSVEIDEAEMEDAVGMVHFGCVTPTNRILGLAGYKEPLAMEYLDFDAPQWVSLLERGQGQLTGYRKSFNDSVTILGWNSANHVNDGPYCIKITYDDGYSTFVTKGKDIHRFKPTEIDIQIERFNKSIHAPKKQGDVPGRIIGRNMFGYTENLLTLLKEGEIISKVTAYEKSRYSKMNDSNASKFDNDYTPLGILLDFESGDELSIQGLMPLVSDPIKFDALHANWNASGHVVGKCRLKIIKSDLELEVYLKLFEQQGLMPVIDPTFDIQTQELVSGFVIQDMTQKLLDAETGKWTEGEMAMVVFDEGRENYPVGILLTDEFVAEDGEESVLWRPVEEGKELDVQYMMPTKFLKKIME